MSNTEVDINWQIDSDEIKRITNAIIKDTSAMCDEIAATKEFTYHNVLARMNEMERLFSNVYCTLLLFSKTAESKTIRDSCNDAVDELNKFSIEIKMRKDLFDVLQAFKEANTQELDYESKRYLERCIIEGKQNGLHLDGRTMEKVKELKKRIANLQLQFATNLSENNKKIPFTKEELDGIPDIVLNGLEKNENGDYLATFKYPVYFPFMKNCKVAKSRQRMYIEFNSRCVDTNTPILEDILQLRHELATTLGYKSYSEYILELCMAKNPDTVAQFLNTLATQLKPLLEQEFEILLKYKKEECEKLGMQFDGKINQSDVKYYFNCREHCEFKVDQVKLQEYFPLETVMKGTFDIYQRLLALEFQPVTGTVNFHHEADLYKVTDRETKELMGYFYTDLFPRDGKYTHLAVFPIISECRKLDGQRQYPICAMICNFTRPTNQQPALLTHFEVEIFFHEFGHVMHQICAKANFIKFSGTKVERDFLEAPSQMLENWVWEKESLRLMTKHYKDGSPIDETLLDNLVRSKVIRAGHYNLREIVPATIDQILHQNPKSCTKTVYQKCVEDLLSMNVEDESLNMVAHFEHLVDDYESRYYSYLWSEVFSQDMFESRFKKEGILNPKTGLDYRKCILEPGGSKDANTMLFNFLGREPNMVAFLNSKGINKINNS